MQCYSGAQKKIKMTPFMKYIIPISDLVFYNIKLPPCSGSLGSTLQLTGALRWGTVWTSSSTGIGIMKGRSWTLVFY